MELISSAAQGGVSLSSVVIRGTSVYAPPELFAVYGKELGKPLDSSTARAITTALLAKYEADGYSRPQVRVDDALVSLGILRLDVVEPRITAITINGDPGPHLARLEDLGERLRDEVPLRPTAMQSTLQLMRALPGLSLSANTTRDATDPHAYRLDLDTDFEPLSGTVRLTNRGTDEAGPNFLLGQLVANGVLAGRTSIGTTFGAATDYDEYRGLGVFANVEVGSAGMRASFTGFRSRSNPHEIVDRDDSHARERITLGLSRPIAAFERFAASWSATLDLDDFEIRRSGLRLRDERLRMLQLGSRLSWRGNASTQHVASVDVIKGLDAFGSGLSAVDLVADPRTAFFLATRWSFTRLTRWGGAWSLRLDALAQQSADVLPYNERFKIGGDRLGRGFEVAEIAGDQGIGAKVEIRRALVDAPARLGRASLHFFSDVGAAWKQDVPGRESATTAGFGFTTQRSRLTGSLELAKPLTHPDVEGRKDLALFAEIAVAL